RLDLLLDGALPGRKILAVGDDLGRNRRCGRCGLGARDEALFSFTEPNTHGFPPLESCTADHCARETVRGRRRQRWLQRPATLLSARRVRRYASIAAGNPSARLADQDE